MRTRSRFMSRYFPYFSLGRVNNLITAWFKSIGRVQMYVNIKLSTCGTNNIMTH